MRLRIAGCLMLLASSIAAPAWAEADLTALQRGIDEHPADPAAYERYALGAMGEKRWDDAIAKLGQGVARVPSFERGYYLLAVAHRSRGDWSQAASYYRVCISLGYQSNDSRYGLGKALAALGDRAAAIEALRVYVDSEKDPAKARYVAAARNELADLEGHGGVDRVKDTMAADAAALRAEAERWKATGNQEQTTAAWRKVVAAAPDDAYSQNELGTALFSQKHYPEAVEAFSAATVADPSYAVAWFNLAGAERKAGHTEGSVRAAERFVALQPNDPDGFYALGQARESAGDGRGAVEAYHRYIAMERRPDRRKLVDKAIAASSALSSRLGDNGDALAGDDVLPFGATQRGIGDLRNPFDPAMATGAADADDLLNPFGSRKRAEAPSGAATLDPFAAESGDKVDTLARLREWAAALSTYRRALAAHTERVSARYDRGVALLLAGHLREAQSAWESIPLDDEALVAARRALDKLRAKAH